MHIKTPLSVTAGAAALLGIAWLVHGGAGADPCRSGDGRATIGPDGGAVCLEGTATVAFPAGAFAAPAEVMLTTSADRNVATLFQDTTAMFLTAGRLDYELRIGTGATPPQAAAVQVTMPVPEDLLQFTLTGHTLEAFAAIERGTPETRSSWFEFLESEFDPATGTISFQVPQAAFAATALTQGSVQAIVTLAPTLSGGDCH